MLHVVGGTYFEYCAEPERRDLLGSGLRAAAAVSRLTKVLLHTYADKRSRSGIEANAATFSVPVDFTPRRQAIRFEYSHPLATPIVVPPIGYIASAKSIALTADAMLCFGMLEGTAKVTAKRAVYDPQSPFDPRPFAESGSTSQELALVLNGREALMLAGLRTRSFDSVAKRLFARSGAAVIVVKRGTHGATVFTRGRVTTVPAYRTTHVWKLGSGDVFAGVFAAYWALRRADAHAAAARASEAAALYCDTHALPLPSDFRRIVSRRFAPIAPRRRSSPASVYLAGPFFTMAQRWLINEARRTLQQQGLRVFSPLHDVGHGTADQVVPADLKALARSDAVFAIADGLDSGTLFEVGYASARGIPVVAFVQNEDAGALKMLEGSACRLCDDFTTAIYQTVWRAISA